jgi:pimeloyl-ACP methyl ester carboxylesterase
LGVPTIEKRELRLHGHRVVVRTGGGHDRPVLVLVHGMAGSSGTWQAVLPALADRYRVLAPDLLGHGASDKPAQDYSLGAHANVLRDLLVALDVERATVVGHSLGGGVAMQLAYQHPERCERLVLVSSGGLGPEVSWLLRALTLPGAEYLMPLIFPSFVRDAGNAVSRRLHRLGFRAPRLEQEWRSYISLTDADNRLSFVRTLRSVVGPGGQTVSALDRLYLASHLPTLILWGGRDRMIPAHHALAAQEALPGSRLVLFEDAGHFPHTEDPVRFVEAIAEFVDSTEAARLDEPRWKTLLDAGPPG